MRDEQISRLVEWLSDHGGHIQSGIKVAFSDIYGYYLRSVRELDCQQAVVSVPRALTLSVDTIDHAQDKWSDEFCSNYQDDPYVITRFLLMDEFLHGQRSWWWPYISCLPQPSEDRPYPFDTPLWFDEQDMEWIAGTGLETATQQRHEMWFAEYKAGMKYLSHMVHVDSYTWTLYKWASTVISSRCFPSRPLQIEENGVVHKSQIRETSPKGLERNRHDQFPVLVPVLDLANHDPNASVTWIINAHGYAFHTDEQVAPDTQVFNNYGAKGNEELLMGYGFTKADNPADVLSLRFQIIDCPQKAFARDIICGGGSLPLKVTAAQVGLEQLSEPSEFTLAPDVFFLRYGRQLSEELLDTVRLTVANARELRDLAQHNTCTSDRLLTQARGQLVLALSQRRCTLSTCIALKSDVKPETIRQLMIQNYAIGQAKILDYHLEDLRRLLPVMEGSDDICTLEYIFTSGPDWLKNPLRKLARVVCGTRNHQKIQQRGLEEVFMVLGICLIRISLSRDHKDCHELPTMSLVSGVGGRLTKWLNFLKERFCPPPGWVGICKNNLCSCSTRNNSELRMPAAVESHSVGIPSDMMAATAFSIIQRGLLSDTLDSITLGASKYWTKEFVSWGYGVWCSEAVTIPVEDIKSDDPNTNDSKSLVKALFLEVLPSNDDDTRLKNSSHGK